MATSVNNNLIVLDDFKNDILSYETHVDSTRYLDAALSLKTALDRMVISCPLDAFQMIRYLAIRMTTTEHYTDNKLLLIADVSVALGGSDRIVNIVYKLKQINNDNPFTYDEIWYSTVNFNIAIKRFFETYLVSDIYLLKSINQNNLINVNASTSVIKSGENDALVTISLGKTNVDLSLLSFQKQTVTFSVDPTLDLPETYDSNFPLTIITDVTIKAGVQEFILDKSVKFTDNVLCILEWFSYIECTLAVSSHARFKFPNHFFSYKLDLISINSGDTWIASNITVLPAKFDK
jgi:hypothetical protein